MPTDASISAEMCDLEMLIVMKNDELENPALSYRDEARILAEIDDLQQQIVRKLQEFVYNDDADAENVDTDDEDAGDKVYDSVLFLWREPPLVKDDLANPKDRAKPDAPGKNSGTISEKDFEARVDKLWNERRKRIMYPNYNRLIAKEDAMKQIYKEGLRLVKEKASPRPKNKVLDDNKKGVDRGSNQRR